MIIPSYQYGRFLHGSLGSVLTQDNVDLEVLVIDDGSTDDSAKIAARIAAEDPRVEVRVHEHNLGHIATYNEGMQWASGEYVLLLGADDVVAEGALARAAALLDAHPDVGFAYGWARTFRSPEPPRIRGQLRGWTIWDGHEWMRSRFEQGGSGILSPEVLMQRSLYDKLGGYDQAYQHAADFDMWMRCASVADVGRVDGIEQAFYRRHPAQLTATIHADLRYKLECRLEIFGVVAGRGVLAGSEELYRRATRELANIAVDWAANSNKPIDELEAEARSLVDFATRLDPHVRRRASWWLLKPRRRLVRHAPRLAGLLRRRGVRNAVVHRYWKLRGSP